MLSDSGGIYDNICRAAIPLIPIAMMTGVIVTLAQTRLMFSTESLMPKFSRLILLKE